MSRRRFLAAALLAFTTGIPAKGQTIDVRTLALRPSEMPELHLKGADKHHPLRFSDTQPGEAVAVPREDPLPLYRKALDPAGKETFEVAHRIKLPEGAKGILLLGWTVGDEARFIAIHDDFAAARFNDWLLINAASKPVAFSVGRNAKPVVIAPGKSLTHRITAAQGQGTAVLAQAPFEGQAKTFFSTFWPVHADKRTVVLFIDDGSALRVKRISDKLPPPAAAP